MIVSIIRSQVTSPRQAELKRAMSTTEHTSFHSWVDQVKEQKKRLYGQFIDFCKAFDTVSNEFSYKDSVHSKFALTLCWLKMHYMIKCWDLLGVLGVFQRYSQICSLSPTLYGHYIDEVMDCIHGGGQGIDIFTLSRCNRCFFP